jgi:hypothetical protein
VTGYWGRACAVRGTVGDTGAGCAGAGIGAGATGAWVTGASVTGAGATGAADAVDVVLIGTCVGKG